VICAAHAFHHLREQLATPQEGAALQVKIDAIRAAQREVQTELDALMPSVLDRAFRAEL